MQIHALTYVQLFLCTGTLAASIRSVGPYAACQELASQLTDHVAFQNSSSYILENSEFWDKAAILSPACIVTAQSAEQISQALRTIIQYQAQFSVRSGGHTPIPGAANNNGGVLLTADNLTDISIVCYEGRTVAQVGTGLRWYEVYGWLADKNLTTIGGRYATVGVGGLSTGGGISYYRSVHGWVADNIMGFQVVTAQGHIIQANAASNADLFWALKGGSGNFGFVTHLYLGLYPAIPIYGGNFLTNASGVDALIAASASFADTVHGGTADPLAAANPTVQFALDTRQRSSFTNLFYNASLDSAPRALQNFTKVPLSSSSTVAGPRTFNSFIDETKVFGNDFRRLFRATSVKCSPAAVHLVQQVFDRQAQALKSIVNGSITVTYQYMSEPFVEAAHVIGDAMDLLPSNGPFIAILVASAWQTASDDAYLLGFLTSLVQAIDTASKTADLYYPFVFLNDAGAGQSPFPFYGGGSSLPKMQAIAEKYDPQRVFQKLATGAFKLSSYTA